MRPIMPKIQLEYSAVQAVAIPRLLSIDPLVILPYAKTIRLALQNIQYRAFENIMYAAINISPKK